MNDNAHNQDHNITKRATKTTHKNYNINTKIWKENKKEKLAESIVPKEKNN